MSSNGFGDDLHDRSAVYAAVAEVNRLRADDRAAADEREQLRERFLARDFARRRAALIAAQREEMLARNGAAVAGADEGAQRRLVREAADGLGDMEVDADADTYEDEFEPASDSEEDEDDEDEGKKEKKEVIAKMREENDQRFGDYVFFEKNKFIR